MYPDMIAAAVPIAGAWTSPREGVTGGAIAPIFAFHGEADEVIPVDFAAGAITTLRPKARQAELARYPGIGHTISRTMRRDIFERLAGLTR